MSPFPPNPLSDMPNNPFPLTLKVGARLFEASLEDGVALRKEGKAGEIRYNSGKILIADDLPPAYQAEILVHEILHALVNDSGADLPEEDEEFVVCLLSPRLTAFLADNPSLLPLLNALLSS